jgi:hypothetical protein
MQNVNIPNKMASTIRQISIISTGGDGQYDGELNEYKYVNRYIKSS